jgi:folylpolyglutamate synthase/dihydropteroate synthase
VLVVHPRALDARLVHFSEWRVFRAATRSQIAMAAEWPRDMAAAELAVRLCISSAERQRRMARIGATGPWAVRAWLERLGLWEATQALRVVHVAGTKGKGSTCAMTEACLRAGGLRTGA